MRNKTIIVLRGIGGNFKSSIARKLVEKGYIQIPEGNREFEETLSADFNRYSDPELNYAVKKLLFKSFLDNDFQNYVSDRGLIDSALMNEFIKGPLDHYGDTLSSKITTSLAYEEECKLLNGYQVTNVLLRTTDRAFLKKIIDDSFDTRACFFNDTESYLECQEIYTNFVMSHYNNVLRLNMDDIPDAEKYSEALCDYVTKLVDQVIKFTER